jgi:hypothetical protein
MAWMEGALALLFLLIALYWQNKDYPDTLDFKYMQYGEDNNGDHVKPVVVVIPGLDGATAFFTGTVQ